MFSRNVHWYWELNISLTNSKMENRLLEDTSMPWFPEKPIKRYLSKKEVDKVVATNTNVFENINLKMNLHKTNTTDVFTIENYQLNITVY